jgi:hypothetical protein
MANGVNRATIILRNSTGWADPVLICEAAVQPPSPDSFRDTENRF